MSLTGSFSQSISACGITITGSVPKTGTIGIEPVTTNLPVGNAGTLLTRTEDDTGTITLEAGHTIENGDVVDVHWSGGCRYGMTATTSGGTSVSADVDGGAGDVLPVEDTEVVVTVPVVLDLTFDGDNLVLIGVGANQQASVRFLDSGSAVLLSELVIANGSWGWASGMGVANPLTGNAVASVLASNGSAVSVCELKITGLQYSA